MSLPDLPLRVLAAELPVIMSLKFDPVASSIIQFPVELNAIVKPNDSEPSWETKPPPPIAFCKDAFRRSILTDWFEPVAEILSLPPLSHIHFQPFNSFSLRS